MKSKFLCLALLLAPCSLLLIGCVGQAVPKTEISGSLAGKPFTFSAPKDVTLGSLTLNADANGTVSLSVSNLTARMNPDVITTTGTAQKLMIDSIFDGTGKLIQAGAAAAK